MPSIETRSALSFWFLTFTLKMLKNPVFSFQITSWLFFSIYFLLPSFFELTFETLTILIATLIVFLLDDSFHVPSNICPKAPFPIFLPIVKWVPKTASIAFDKVNINNSNDYCILFSLPISCVLKMNCKEYESG